MEEATASLNSKRISEVGLLSKKSRIEVGPGSFGGKSAVALGTYFLVPHLSIVREGVTEAKFVLLCYVSLYTPSGVVSA